MMAYRNINFTLLFILWDPDNSDEVKIDRLRQNHTDSSSKIRDVLFP